MINPQMTPIAKIGDLISIKSYANRLFRVDSYTHLFTYERGVLMEGIDYYGYCVTTGEDIIGAQEDITVICQEAQADEFLASYEHPEVPQIMYGLFTDWALWEEVNDMKQPIKPIKAVTAKKDEPTREELVDVLLDEMNNVNNAIELIGDEDGHYAKRLAEIKAELKEVTESAEGGR